MAVEESVLLGKWVHSHEEDPPGARVFRPATHPFPPSRGRVGYEFLPRGVLVQQGPGPTDRRATSTGTWSIDAQSRLVLRLPGRPDEVIEIVALEHHRLVLKK